MPIRRYDRSANRAKPHRDILYLFFRPRRRAKHQERCSGRDGTPGRKTWTCRRQRRRWRHSGRRSRNGVNPAGSASRNLRRSFNRRSSSTATATSWFRRSIRSRSPRKFRMLNSLSIQIPGMGPYFQFPETLCDPCDDLPRRTLRRDRPLNSGGRFSPLGGGRWRASVRSITNKSRQKTWIQTKAFRPSPVLSTSRRSSRHRPARADARAVRYQFDSAEPGAVVLTATPDDKYYSPLGFVHGGYAAVLLDSCMAAAIVTSLEPSLPP